MDMKYAPPVFLTCVAALLLLCVTPASGKDASCQFRVSGVTLGFGNLDPSNAVQVVRALQGTGEVGDCNSTGLNVTVSIAVGSSSRVMKNGSGGVIPYTLSGFPVSFPQPGNNKYPSFLPWLSATIQAGAYADQPAGTYSDTVTISVSP